MSAVAKTRLLPDTSLNIVNRTASASTITKNRVVGVGTPVGSELAVESLDVAGASASLGVIQEDIESGKGGTAYGPGSICAVESDGSGTIAYGAEVIAVAGGTLAASGRIKTLPAAAGTYYVIGKSVNSATVPATAGAQALIRLVEPRKIIVA